MPSRLLVDGAQLHGVPLATLLDRPDMRRSALRCRVPAPSIERRDGSAEPVLARVNHGRWIADCPCNGAMMVYLDTPWFWCSSCANRDLRGALRPVVLPSAAHIQRIEAALCHRDEINQNWEPGELIGALRNENSAHGLPINGAVYDGGGPLISWEPIPDAVNAPAAEPTLSVEPIK